MQFFRKVCVMETVTGKKKPSRTVKHERHKKLFFLDNTWLT